MERRSKPRIQVPFLAKVSGRDAEGKRFKEDTVLDNLSRGGLYLRLTRNIARRTRLFVVIYLSESGRLAVLGEVLRVEPQSDETCGVAMKFTRHRLL
jgi:hypothetical protein